MIIWGAIEASAQDHAYQWTKTFGITDQILNGQQGIVTIDSNTVGSVVATVMQYGRTETQGIKFMYGIPAKQPLGTVMKGTYNTFLNQGCNLLLVNPTASDAKVDISLVRYDGTEADSTELTVPAHGLYNDDLCSRDEKNVYGVVTVQPEQPNTVYATVVRLGENDSYRFPTPVRQ